MSNKAHLHPHQKKRHASWITSLLVVILFIAIFALAVALAASGRGAPFSNLRLLRPDPETNWRQARATVTTCGRPTLTASRQPRCSGLLSFRGG